jgi:hypothetical protein
VSTAPDEQWPTAQFIFERDIHRSMYAVVGCDECQALWVVEGEQERSQCPRCGRTRLHEKRRKFVTTEDGDHAREVRASMLAARSGHGDAFAKLDSFAKLGTRAESAGIDDETYLDGSGIDPESVAEAGETSAESRSQTQVVRDAVRELDEPTDQAVLDYAERHGVSPEFTERALAKLVRNGELSRHRGQYRSL